MTFIKKKNHFFFLSALVDVSNPPDEESPVDIYAIGFEEIVDLNASNIMAARWVSSIYEINTLYISLY